MKKTYKFFIAIFFALSSSFAMAQYCTPTYSTGCTYGDGLTLFQLGTINQTIACDGAPNFWYHDYTASSTTLQVNNPGTLTIQAGYSNTYVSVWVDYNNNNVFDASEMVVNNLVCSATGTNYTANITVPAGTPDGNHRMRYRTSWASNISDPCASVTFGNSADFTLNTYTYCPTLYTTGCSWGDGLTLFQLGTINQTIGCDGVPNSWYHDYTASSTTLHVGDPYTLTVQAGYTSTYTSVWIDFDNNGTFDPSEMVVNNLVCSATATNYTANITVPLGTPDGNHRMRYRTSWASNVTDPCASVGYGNSADFTINTYTYCSPSYSSGCSFGDGLTLFQLGSINQTIGCDGVPTSYYHDYSAASTLIYTGVPYTLTVQAGYSNTYTSVWIDFDNNGTFDPAEMVVNSLNCSSTGTNFTATINVPVGTIDGNHKMRFATNYFSGITDPCMVTTYGNYADFTVVTSNLPAPADIITGVTPLCTGNTGVAFSIPAIPNATGYDWILPVDATIASGANTNAITVDFSGIAVSGIISVTGTNTYGNGDTSNFTYTINPSSIPTLFSTPLLLSESFENAGTAPNGWAIESVSGSTSITFDTLTYWPSGFTAVDGNYLVMFNSFSVSTGTTRLKDTIPFSTQGLSSASVEFSWLESTAYSGSNDRVDVEWSTDGIIWNIAGTFSRYNALQGWKVKNQPLPAGALGQANLYIAFDFTSEYGNDCYLDLASVKTITDVVCAGSIASYGTDPGMTGYNWVVSPGGTIISGSGTNSISVQWNNGGTENVSVNYNNAFGCAAVTPTNVNITVNALPIPTISGTTSICAGTTGEVYTTESGMTNYNWTISSGGTITSGSGTDIMTASWNTAGSENVSINYTDLNGCTASSPFVYNVTVEGIPTTPVITDNSGTLTSNASTGNQWYSVAGGLIAGATGQTYIPVANGTYYVIVTLLTCSSDTSNQITILNVSIDTYSSENLITVYPNPANNVINVIQANTGEATINLFDATGKLVYNNLVYNKNNKINIENLARGIYSLQYISNGSTSTLKIVKM